MNTNMVQLTSAVLDIKKLGKLESELLLITNLYIIRNCTFSTKRIDKSCTV
jgi:hypothetical protein